MRLNSKEPINRWLLATHVGMFIVLEIGQLLYGIIANGKVSIVMMIAVAFIPIISYFYAAAKLNKGGRGGANVER
jgi:hypothetical protein